MASLFYFIYLNFIRTSISQFLIDYFIKLKNNFISKVQNKVKQLKSKQRDIILCQIMINPYKKYMLKPCIS